MYSTAALLALAIIPYVSASVCKGNLPIEWVSDPADCSVFHMCMAGKEYSFQCPENSVVDIETRSCVPKGSQFDTCTERVQKTPSLCKLSEDRYIKHPDSCAKFYDCSGKKTSGAEPDEKECEYPLLFDEETKRCEHPESTKCGRRFEPKSPCQYEANQCRTAHCIPCHIRHPNCLEKEDGLHAWPGKEGSPDYVVCAKERVVYQGQCHSETSTQVFHPRKRLCVDIKDYDYDM